MLKLPRKKKKPPKTVPWLTNISRLIIVLLVGGIVLTQGYLLVEGSRDIDDCSPEELSRSTLFYFMATNMAAERMPGICSMPM